MKKLALAALCALTLVTGTPNLCLPTARAATLPMNAGIDWHTEKDDVVAQLNQAAKTGVPVMVVLHADWCPWCVKLDTETFADANVIALSHQFVCIKIDTETDWGKRAMQTLGVSGIPYTVFYKGGRKVNTVNGYKDASDFKAEMQKSL